MTTTDPAGRVAAAADRLEKLADSAAEFRASAADLRTVRTEMNASLRTAEQAVDAVRTAGAWADQVTDIGRALGDAATELRDASQEMRAASRSFRAAGPERMARQQQLTIALLAVTALASLATLAAVLTH